MTRACRQPVRGRFSGEYATRQIASRGHGESHRRAGYCYRPGVAGRRGLSRLVEPACSFGTGGKGDPRLALSKVTGDTGEANARRLGFEADARRFDAETALAVPPQRAARYGLEASR